MQKLNVPEDNEIALHVNEFENVFSDDEGTDDDDDELASMESDGSDDTDMLRYIRNSSVDCNKKPKLSLATTAEGTPVFDDFFKRTVADVKEINRQMEESGVFRVLDTFDTKKIKENVGEWLKRGTQEDHPWQTSECSEEIAHYTRFIRVDAIKNAHTFTVMNTYRTVRSLRRTWKNKYRFTSNQTGITKNYYKRKHKCYEQRHPLKKCKCSATSHHHSLALSSSYSPVSTPSCVATCGGKRCYKNTQPQHFDQEYE